MTAVYKIILAGDGGTGKTTLIRRYLTDEFVDDTKTTIGVEFARSTIELENFGDVILQIWDFAGEERFRFVLPSYVAGSHAAALVFDKSRPPTLYSLTEWLQIIRKSSEEIPIILVGSKIDLAPDPPDMAFIDRLRLEYGVLDYYETSAKTGENVKEVFTQLAAKIVEHGGKR